MQPQPGDDLRDRAAELLSPRYGEVKSEVRVFGKKADLFFENHNFGKSERIYVEAKDYAQRLSRKMVAEIWSDYSGLVARSAPAILLLITRHGLSPDAQAFVDQEQAQLRHQTIREIENSALGLDSYVRTLVHSFDEGGLSEYYIAAAAHSVSYSGRDDRKVSNSEIDIFAHLKDWLDGPPSDPIAILAGYGAGKTSLAKRIVSYQAEVCNTDESARRPILIRLGGLTRHSSISGLLGTMFTRDFPVPNFNYHVFSKLNECGRLFIILDGFDEMKHAMSWSDFQLQVSDLARLVEGNSRVLLLGRPTAFLSFEEHLQVLRGLRKFGDQLRRVPDWPQFSEFELSDFKDEQILAFVDRYLRHVAARFKLFDSAQLETRISEVQGIARQDLELFKKPVHLKILSDLAADDAVNLSRFEGGITRWDLYECLFADLQSREFEKEARRPLSGEQRQSFLRELAYWLWTSNNGSVAFRISELPPDLVTNTHEVEAAQDAELRELLTGSFLEKKDGDTFFFGHRSFAEFLVADRLIRVVPTGDQYGVYSKLIADGVAQFLVDYSNTEIFSEWVDGLTEAKGQIDIEFFGFLQERNGPIDEIWQRLPKEAPVRAVAEAYIPDANRFLHDQKRDPYEGLGYRLFQLLKRGENDIFFPVFDLILRYFGYSGSSDRSFSVSIAAKIVERVFVAAKVDTEARKSFVPESLDEARKLMSRVLGDVENRTDGRYVRLNWDALLAETRKHVSQKGLSFSLRAGEQAWGVRAFVDVSWADLLEGMDEHARQQTRLHFSSSKTFHDVFTRAVPLKRSKSSSRHPA